MRRLGGRRSGWLLLLWGLLLLFLLLALLLLLLRGGRSRRLREDHAGLCPGDDRRAGRTQSGQQHGGRQNEQRLRGDTHQPSPSVR
jgi:hypothetical protein